MAADTVSSFSNALKTLWQSRRVKAIAYENNPALAMIPKSTDFVGENKKVVFWYGGSQGGGSRTFATAYANQSAELVKSLLLTRKKDYALGSVENEALMASQSDVGAFLKLQRSKLDSLLRVSSRNLAISLFRNRGGARGRVASIASGDLTLTSVADVVNFEVGQTIVQSTADGTSGALGSGSSVITGVNRRTGVLTAANWTNFSNNDYLFRAGDFGASISGFSDWVPTTAPTGGDNFYGMDRSTDTRLYGQYHDGTGQDIVEAILDLEMKLHVEGGSPTVLFVNPRDLNTIRKNLGSDVLFGQVGAPDKSVNISFKSIILQGQSGDVNLIGDRNCPVGLGYMLDLKTWEFASLGEAPALLSNSLAGDAVLWVNNQDQVEYRIGYYGNVACYAPNYNGVVALPTL